MQFNQSCAFVATWTWGREIKKNTSLTSSDLAVFPSAPSRPECSQWRKVCVYRHRPRDRTSRSFSPSPACPPMTEDYRWCHHHPIAWSLPTDRRARRRGPRRSPKKAMSIAPRPRADVVRVATVQVDVNYLHSWSFSSSMAAWLLILWRLHAANRGPQHDAMASKERRVGMVLQRVSSPLSGTTPRDILIF